MATLSQNRADETLTTEDIRTLIRLFENEEAWVDYFIEKCAADNLPEAAKNEIRKSYPYADDLRRTILRMANSIPGFKFGLRKGIDPALEQGEEDGETLKLSKGAQILADLNAMCEKRSWEGEKSLWAALPSWRAFTLLAGDTFVKIPRINGEALPERMGPQDTALLLSKTSRKGIDGYRFTYSVGGGGIYTELGATLGTTVETVTRDSWTVERNGKTEKTDQLSFGFIPVAHLAWEEREGSPRGLPLGARLTKICLKIAAVRVGRRLGNKRNAAPITVIYNSTTGIPQLYSGMVLELDDKADGSKAKVESVGGGLDLTSLASELEDGKRELAEAAFLPYEGKEGAQGIEPASGRAMERLTAAQVAYRISYMLVEQSFLEDLAYKMLVISGKAGEDLKPGDVTVLYDGFGDDQTQLMRRAELLFQERMPRKALQTLGYEDDEIERMLAERSAKDDGDLQSLLKRDQEQDQIDDGKGEEDQP
jgi:hypothetical protein